MGWLSLLLIQHIPAISSMSAAGTPLGCVPGSSVTVPDYLTGSGEYGSSSNTIGSAQVRNPQHLARGTLLSHWDVVEYWADVPQ